MVFYTRLEAYLLDVSVHTTKAVLPHQNMITTVGRYLQIKSIGTCVDVMHMYMMYTSQETSGD